MIQNSDGEIRLTDRLKKRGGEHYEKALVGSQIAALRRENGMTQHSLAKKLGTTQSVISRMESGNQNVTLRMLVRISKVLGKKLEVYFS